MAVTAAPAAPGGGGPQPPWESSINPAPFGSITFYNAQGQVVTGGSITASGLGAYAVASTADPRSGDDKATLYAYTPVDGENPGAWSGINIGPATTYPVAAAPAAISTANPMESDTGGLDEEFATYINTFPNNDTSTTDGYSGLFDIRMMVSGPGIGQESGYWDTVISVDITSGTLQDPTAGTWSVDWPDWTQNTTTTLTASTATGKTSAGGVTLTAKVSPATAGTVSFWSGYGTSGVAQVGTAQTVTSTDGTASVTTTPRAETTAYTAVYTPAIGSADIGSVSAAPNYAIPEPQAPWTSRLNPAAECTVLNCSDVTPARLPTGPHPKQSQAREQAPEQARFAIVERGARAPVAAV
jgi:hypothetical protein